VTTVMIVLPDAESLQRIAGSLAYLSAKKYRVHVGIEADPPGGPNLGSFNGQYLGLSVSRLPVLADDRCRPFATVVRTWLRRLRVPPDQVRPAAQPGTATAGGGWLRPRLLGALARLERAVPAPAMVLAALEQRRPDLLVVTRLGGLDAPHVDYLRAARALGIPSFFLTVDHDDVARGDLANQIPDCVSVWNRHQRREAVEQGVPIRRTCIVGAHLSTDVLDDRAVGSRQEYCRAVGADPSRRLVVVAVARLFGGEGCEWLRAWNAARLQHSDALVRDSAVIVITRSSADAEALRSIDLPGLSAVVAATGDYIAARHVHDALAHVDAVVTWEMDIALEGIARARPVVAVAQDASGKLARFCARMRRDFAWPMVAGSVEEQIDCLAGILNGAWPREGLIAARGGVRIHGSEVEPGFLLTRVFREVTLSPAAESVARWRARAAMGLSMLVRAFAPEQYERRPATDGKRRFLMVVPPDGSIDRWASLILSLIDRGHRVAAVPLPAGVAVAGDSSTSSMPGLTILAGPPPRRGLWQWAAQWVAASDLQLARLTSSTSEIHVRWRRRLDGLRLPWGGQGLLALDGQVKRLERARRHTAALDAHFPPSMNARRLLSREQPDAVLAFPSLDPQAAVGSWAAQGDLLRAARMAGIPVAASIGSGDSSVNDLLAGGALRPHGVNRAAADAMAAELEHWLDRSPERHRRQSGVGEALSALAAGGALAGIVAAAAAGRAVESRAPWLARTSARIRGLARRAVRRVTSPAPGNEVPR